MKDCIEGSCSAVQTAMQTSDSKELMLVFRTHTWHIVRLTSRESGTSSCLEKWDLNLVDQSYSRLFLFWPHD